MRTALGARFEIYDFDTEKTEVVQGRPIAWMDAMQWLSIYEEEFPEAAQATLGVYVWGLCAIRRAGKATELGVAEGDMTKQAVIDAMARIDIRMSNEGEEPPLDQRRKRK